MKGFFPDENKNAACYISLSYDSYHCCLVVAWSHGHTDMKTAYMSSHILFFKKKFLESARSLVLRDRAVLGAALVFRTLWFTASSLVFSFPLSPFPLCGGED